MFQRLHHSKLAAYTALTTPSKRKLEQSSCSTAARQMRLNQCGLRASSVSQATVDRLVVDFVTEALLPFSVVCLPSFKRLVTGLQPSRTVLCRKTLMARIGQSSYMQLRRVGLLVIICFFIIIVCNLVLYDVYFFLGLWYYNYVDINMGFLGHS